jgi:hypothetical protein
MLPAPVDSEIRRMIDAGVPQRQIAERLNVSRTTVQAIATGRRDPGGRINDELQYPRFATSSDALPERCRGCGGLVYKPCVLCRALRHRVKGEITKIK